MVRWNFRRQFLLRFFWVAIPRENTKLPNEIAQPLAKRIKPAFLLISA
jgi:hypothetical protein